METRALASSGDGVEEGDEARWYLKRAEPVRIIVFLPHASCSVATGCFGPLGRGHGWRRRRLSLEPGAAAAAWNREEREGGLDAIRFAPGLNRNGPKSNAVAMAHLTLAHRVISSNK